MDAFVRFCFQRLDYKIESIALEKIRHVVVTFAVVVILVVSLEFKRSVKYHHLDGNQGAKSSVWFWPPV